MVDTNLQNPRGLDPFSEDKNSGDNEDVCIVMLSGKRSLTTTVKGLKKKDNYEKILRQLKKKCGCNGNVVNDNVLGPVIQLHGDQRRNVSTFLTTSGIAKNQNIKINGF